MKDQVAKDPEQGKKEAEDQMAQVLLPLDHRDANELPRGNEENLLDLLGRLEVQDQPAGKMPVVDAPHAMSGVKNRIRVDVFDDLIGGGRIRDLILENTAESRRVMNQYRKQRKTGDADAMMLKSILAIYELHENGYMFQALGMSSDQNISGGMKKNDPEIAELANYIDLQEKKEYLADQYKLDAFELKAVEGYTLPNKYKKELTNAGENEFYMGSGHHWGKHGDGWTALASALKKIPSFADLGIDMTTYRVPRVEPERKNENEVDFLKNSSPGQSFIHGFERMPKGNFHILSSALTYSKFTTPSSVEKAGGLVALSGRSGVYISPFSGQSTFMDGGEVLYPDGVMTQYKGESPGGYQKSNQETLPVFYLQENYQNLVGPIRDDHKFEPLKASQVRDLSARFPPLYHRMQKPIEKIQEMVSRSGFLKGKEQRIMAKVRVLEEENRLDELRSFETQLAEEELDVEERIRREIWDVPLSREAKKAIMEKEYTVQGETTLFDVDIPLQMFPEELEALIREVREL